MYLILRLAPSIAPPTHCTASHSFTPHSSIHTFLFDRYVAALRLVQHFFRFIISLLPPNLIICSLFCMFSPLSTNFNAFCIPDPAPETRPEFYILHIMGAAAVTHCLALLHTLLRSNSIAGRQAAAGEVGWLLAAKPDLLWQISPNQHSLLVANVYVCMYAAELPIASASPCTQYCEKWPTATKQAVANFFSFTLLRPLCIVEKSLRRTSSSPLLIHFCFIFHQTLTTSSTPKSGVMHPLFFHGCLDLQQ